MKDESHKRPLETFTTLISATIVYEDITITKCAQRIHTQSHETTRRNLESDDGLA